MAETCWTCHLVHAADVTCLNAQKIAMRSLLEKIGQKTTCRGCPATIYMVRHSNGAITPYTEAGLNHFVDCVAREQFARKKPNVE
jgi:hypothetical protein